jgi:hypothetical protein
VPFAASLNTSRADFAIRSLSARLEPPNLTTILRVFCLDEVPALAVITV